jgi:8-oxo-dGTP pyrophosphatase MutT (NUDIX family)
MINKAAAIVIKNRSVLYLRKQDFLFHILPGGRIEEGETVMQALEREMMEELCTRIKIVKDMGIIEGKGFSKNLDELETVKLAIPQVEILDEIKLSGEIIDHVFIKYGELHKYLMTPIGIKTVEFLHEEGLID